MLHIEDGTFRGTFDTSSEVLGRRARPIPENGLLRLRLVSDLELMQYVLVDIDNPARGLVDIESSLPTPDWFRQQLIFHTDLDEPTTVDGVQVTPVAAASDGVLRAPAEPPVGDRCRRGRRSVSAQRVQGDRLACPPMQTLLTRGWQLRVG